MINNLKVFLRLVHTIRFSDPFFLTGIVSAYENVVSRKGMQSGLPVFFVGEFGTFGIFGQNDCLGNLSVKLNFQGVRFEKKHCFY